MTRNLFVFAFVSMAFFGAEPCLGQESKYPKELKILATLKGHKGPILAVAFSVDGSKLASVSADDAVKIWDLRTGEELSTLRKATKAVKVPAKLAPALGVSKSGYPSLVLSFSPDDTTLASIVNGETNVWDVRTSKEIVARKAQAVDVVLSISPDTKLVASAREVPRQGTITLLDIKTGAVKATLKGHTDTVQCMAFSADGSTLASGSLDNTVKVWDLKTGEEKAKFKGQSSPIWCVALNANGTMLACGSFTKVLQLWDVKTRQEIPTHGGTAFDPPQADRDLRSLTFSPNGKHLSVVNFDRSFGVTDYLAWLWDVRTGEAQFTVPWGKTRCVAFNTDGTVLAEGRNDSTIKLWQIPSTEKAGK